jgi:hypothetical protein
MNVLRSILVTGVLLAVTGACGCWGSAPASRDGGVADGGPPDTCCGALTPYNWECLVDVVLPCPAPGGCAKPPSCAYVLEACFATQTDASLTALKQAGQMGTVVAGMWPTCNRKACPTGRHRAPPVVPLGAPLCAGTITTCAADADPCTSDAECCTGLHCGESITCESCAMDGEGCAANGDCCSGLCSSINTCSTTCPVPPCPVPPPAPSLDGGV